MASNVTARRRRSMRSRARPREASLTERDYLPPAGDLGSQARHLSGPLPRSARRVCCPGGGRQRHRCRRGRRYRARRAAERPRQCGGRSAHHPLSRREPEGLHGERPGRLAQARDIRLFSEASRRQDPARCLAHSRAGGAGRLDPGAAAVGQHELRCRGCGRRSLCQGRFCCASRAFTRNGPRTGPSICRMAARRGRARCSCRATSPRACNT